MNKRQFLKAHPPDYSAAGRLLQMLDRHRRLMKRGWESVEMGKIPPEHCNYLAWFLETKTIPLLQKVVEMLERKAQE